MARATTAARRASTSAASTDGFVAASSLPRPSRRVSAASTSTASAQANAVASSSSTRAPAKKRKLSDDSDDDSKPKPNSASRTRPGVKSGQQVDDDAYKPEDTDAYEDGGDQGEVEESRDKVVDAESATAGDSQQARTDRDRKPVAPQEAWAKTDEALLADIAAARREVEELCEAMDGIYALGQYEASFEGAASPSSGESNVASESMGAFKRIETGESVVERTQIEQMGDLVDKYRHFVVPSTLSTDATSPASPEVVLLSGATGSLGANQLAQLLSRPEVKKVYTLVRAEDDNEAAVRVKASLDDKGLAGAQDPRIVALAADFSQDRLGLSESRFDEIKSDLTVVLHYAWSVNFNLSIGSFEPHIRGACNLIQLCLSSHRLAAFYFASSVSAVAAGSGASNVPEAVTDDPHSAQGMGYARSKWVTEKLCQIASETAPVRAVVLRVGQMVGSTVDGRWNETEAMSLMIKTGDTLHALPELQETPSWLPVDCAASTIWDLVTSEPPSARTSQCWHVLQPRLVHFSSILDSLAATGMTFERVPPAEWSL
ncbi:hypothetical protein JCM8208_004325 [Rhodotorula glutinis]